MRWNIFDVTIQIKASEKYVHVVKYVLLNSVQHRIETFSKSSSFLRFKKSSANYVWISKLPCHLFG